MSAVSGYWNALIWTRRWDGRERASPLPGGRLRCGRSFSIPQTIDRQVWNTETRNEKTQDYGTHLAGRGDPALPRWHRLQLWRLDCALSDPRWPGRGS